MVVPTPKDWSVIISKSEGKGTFINGIPTRSHFACIQVDLSDTEYPDLTNSYNQLNKGYLNGLLIFPDDATITMESFTFNCDNNNNTPVNEAINFTVYKCTQNKITVSELTALMNGGCVFFPFIYNGTDTQTDESLYYYSESGIFMSGYNSYQNNSQIYAKFFAAVPLAMNFEDYEIRTIQSDPHNSSSVRTLVFFVEQDESII